MTRAKLAAAATMVAMTMAGCASVNAPNPFDPHTFQTGEHSASNQLADNLRTDLPTTLPDTPPRPPKGSPTTGPIVPPSYDTGAQPTKIQLRELVQRTVANNLDVKVAGYDPAIEGTRVVEAQGQFDPALFANARYDRRDNATAGQFISDPSVPGSVLTTFDDASDVYSLQGGVRQNLPSGGKAELSYQTAYNDLDPKRTVLNPYWENNLQLEITQPLLRNLGLEINQANITIAKNNQRISTLDFRKALEEQISNVEQTYWQLVQAVREVEIQEDLLARTTRTVDILQARLNQDVSIVQVSQARASEESRRATLVRAKAHVGDLSDQLKRLMNDPSFPVTGGTVLMPGTKPLLEPIKFKLDEQIDTAMNNRFELGQQQIRINSAGVATAVAKNGLLPQLNLRGIAGFQGLDDGFGSAFDSQTDFNHFNWGIGLELEIPIGNRVARSVYQRSLLQREQAIAQYHLLTEQVALDVKTAAREIETSWNEIGSTRLARFAADKALTALQQREDAKEPLTYTFVQLKLDTQERAAQARIAEAQAVSNYNFALARLERAKGTLLRYDNVVLEEEKTPFGVPKKK